MAPIRPTDATAIDHFVIRDGTVATKLDVFDDLQFGRPRR